MSMTGLTEEIRTQLRDEGVTVVPAVLTAEEVAAIRAALDIAVERAIVKGQPLYRAGVDPNDRNVRVLELIGVDPVFEQLVVHPVAEELVRSVLGEHAQLSSFSANIAHPGSGSMGLHSDLMAVLPEPWLAPYGVNVLFYLHDTDEDNGATRYLPGSHRFTTSADASDADLGRTVPIEAPAGSMIAVDGRLWHTSGANRSTARERAVLISFYVSHFIRTQYNWHALLDEPTRARLPAALRALLGLDEGNMRVRLGYAAFQGTKLGSDPFTRV
jgi:ectoine hydroxylase-related dioxygenase (phytanoyl-CoA dioxygenase family)